MNLHTGSLFLIPSSLGIEGDHCIPEYTTEICRELRLFFVENERTARRFLRRIAVKTDFDEVELFVVNKNTRVEELIPMLNLIKGGKNAGVISEAGCPCIADPGSILVDLAHQFDIRVKPLSGPSSLFMALMASGLNGQAFAFSGYLPIKGPDRKRQMLKLESRANQGESQIFMETPYRNQTLLEELVQNLNPKTLLCLATNISLPDENIKTQPLSSWKKKPPSLHKKPTIFILGRRN